jgi:hypothetical protein
MRLPRSQYRGNLGSPFRYRMDPGESRLAGAQWQQIESGATGIDRKQRTCHKVGSHLLQGRDERVPNGCRA